MGQETENPVTGNGAGANSKSWFFVRVHGLAGGILLQLVADSGVVYATPDEIATNNIELDDYRIDHYAKGIVAGNIKLSVKELRLDGTKSYRSDLCNLIKERMLKANQ